MLTASSLYNRNSIHSDSTTIDHTYFEAANQYVKTVTSLWEKLGICKDEAEKMKLHRRYLRAFKNDAEKEALDYEYASLQKQYERCSREASDYITRLQRTDHILGLSRPEVDIKEVYGDYCQAVYCSSPKQTQMLNFLQNLEKATEEVLIDYKKAAANFTTRMIALYTALGITKNAHEKQRVYDEYLEACSADLAKRAKLDMLLIGGELRIKTDKEYILACSKSYVQKVLDALKKVNLSLTQLEQENLSKKYNMAFLHHCGETEQLLSSISAFMQEDENKYLRAARVFANEAILLLLEIDALSPFQEEKLLQMAEEAYLKASVIDVSEAQALEAKLREMQAKLDTRGKDLAHEADIFLGKVKGVFNALDIQMDETEQSQYRNAYFYASLEDETEKNKRDQWIRGIEARLSPEAREIFEDDAMEYTRRMKAVSLAAKKKGQSLSPDNDDCYSGLYFSYLKACVLHPFQKKVMHESLRWQEYSFFFKTK